MSEWYYILEGKVQGPLSDEDIYHAFSCDALSASTMVWHDRMTTWAEANTCQLFRNIQRTNKANVFSRPGTQSEGSCQVSDPASNITLSLQEPIPSVIPAMSSPVIAICSLNHVTESKKSLKPESERLPKPIKIEAFGEPDDAIPSNPGEVAKANVQTWRALFKNRDLQIFACIVALIAVAIWLGHNRQMRPKALEAVPHPTPSSDRAVTAQPRQSGNQLGLRELETIRRIVKERQWLLDDSGTVFDQKVLAYDRTKNPFSVQHLPLYLVIRNESVVFAECHINPMYFTRKDLMEDEKWRAYWRNFDAIFDVLFLIQPDDKLWDWAHEKRLYIKTLPPGTEMEFLFDHPNCRIRLHLTKGDVKFQVLRLDQNGTPALRNSNGKPAYEM